MKRRIVLDTGALIALERRQHSMVKTFRLAVAEDVVVVAPTPVVAEWWRRGRGERTRTLILRSLHLEPPDGAVAKLAGEAVGLVGAGIIDALVMSAASIRGDVVYTSDVDDLTRLVAVFPNVDVARA